MNQDCTTRRELKSVRKNILIKRDSTDDYQAENETRNSACGFGGYVNVHMYGK